MPKICLSAGWDLAVYVSRSCRSEDVRSSSASDDNESHAVASGLTLGGTVNGDPVKVCGPY